MNRQNTCMDKETAKIHVGHFEQALFSGLLTGCVGAGPHNLVKPAQ